MIRDAHVSDIPATPVASDHSYAPRQPTQWYLWRVRDDLFDIRWLTWVTQQRFNPLQAISTLNRSYCERLRRDGRTPRTKHGSSIHAQHGHTRVMHLCLIVSRSLVITFDAGGHGQNTWRDTIANVISFAIPFDVKNVSWGAQVASGNLFKFAAIKNASTGFLRIYKFAAWPYPLYELTCSQ